MYAPGSATMVFITWRQPVESFGSEKEERGVGGGEGVRP